MASRKRNSSTSKSHASKKKQATSEMLPVMDCEEQQPSTSGSSASQTPSIFAEKVTQQLLKLKELWTSQVSADQTHGSKGESSKTKEPKQNSITQNFEMLATVEPFTDEWLRLLRLVFQDFNEGNNMEMLRNHVDAPNIGAVENHDAIVEYVFEKAVSDPKNGAAHASFCKELADVEKRHGALSEKMNTFKCKLAMRCQKEFLKCKKEATKLSEIDEQIRAVQQDQKRTAEKCQLVFLPYEMQRRATGTALFMGELFKVGILTSSVIKCCLELLLQETSEAKVERACKLITMVGEIIERGDGKALDDCFATLSRLLHPSNQAVKSLPVKTEIQRLRKMRMNGWNRCEGSTRSHRITREDLVGLYRMKLREEGTDRMKLVHFISESIENLSLARNDHISALIKITKMVINFMGRDPRITENFAQCLADLVAIQIVTFPEIVLICYAETNCNKKFTENILRLLFVAIYKRHGRPVLVNIIKMKGVAISLRDGNFDRLLNEGCKKMGQMRIENLDNDVD